MGLSINVYPCMHEYAWEWYKNQMKQIFEVRFVIVNTGLMA